MTDNPPWYTGRGSVRQRSAYWPVVPVGEESKDYRIIHKVVAAELT